MLPGIAADTLPVVPSQSSGDPRSNDTRLNLMKNVHQTPAHFFRFKRTESTVLCVGTSSMFTSYNFPVTVRMTDLY